MRRSSVYYAVAAFIALLVLATAAALFMTSHHKHLGPMPVVAGGDTPEESVLEAILAGLASVFREFNELLACVQAKGAARPPALAASVHDASRLAREICGDCVPREFAPALRTWMDQIQRMAGEVEQI